jgi:hypothetical protein
MRLPLDADASRIARCTGRLAQGLPVQLPGLGEGLRNRCNLTPALLQKRTTGIPSGLVPLVRWHRESPALRNPPGRSRTEERTRFGNRHALRYAWEGTYEAVNILST